MTSNYSLNSLNILITSWQSLTHTHKKDFCICYTLLPMTYKCPACGADMNQISSAGEMPPIPFIKIPAWIKDVDVHECQSCHYIGLWRTTDIE